MPPDDSMRELNLHFPSSDDELVTISIVELESIESSSTIEIPFQELKNAIKYYEMELEGIKENG